MGKYKTLAKNTGFVFIGTIGSKLINVIMLPLYTHWLNPEDFGSVDTMSTYSMFIIGFVCLCLPDALFIFPYNATEQKKKEYFSSGAIFSIVAISISSLFFWSASALMKSYEMHNVFSDYTWLIFFMMITSYVQNYCQTFTRCQRKMLQYSIAGIVLTFATAIYAILLIPIYGLKGYAYSLIFAQLTAALYSFIAAKSYKYVQIKGNSVSCVKEMLRYSAPLLPNGIMWWLVNGVNRPIMEHFLGLAAIGIYAIANKFTGMLYSMLSILSTAWSNSVLEEYGKPGFDKFYNNYLRMLATLLVFGGYCLVIFSRPLVVLLTTEEYYEAYRYIPPLMAGIIFSGLSGAVGGIFSATKTSKYFFYSSLWGGISSLVSLLILTPLLGLMGTCLSVAFSFFCMFIARTIYASKFTKVENLSFYIKLGVVYAAISLAELYIYNPYKLLLQSILVIASFVICKSDVMMVLSKIKTYKSGK